MANNHMESKKPTSAGRKGDDGSLRLGARIGQYEIVSLLGRGGFGITCRTRDTQLDRDVAINASMPSRSQQGCAVKREFRPQFIALRGGLLQSVAMLAAVLTVFMLRPVQAVAQAHAEWKVTVTFFERANCGGERGTIRVTGRRLAFFHQGMSYAAWGVDLEPDGSADRVSGRMHVKVAAGTGPRDITTLEMRSVCGLRYLPD